MTKPYLATIVLAAVAASSGCGGGCSSLEPIPGGFPSAARTPNAGQVRISQSGLATVAADPAALAIFACDPSPHPALAIYRPGSLPLLREKLARGERALHSSLPHELVVRVPCDPRALRNVNTPADGDL